MHDHIMREVIMPTISGMAAEGIDYMGFLYAGLMIQSDGSVKVLEFNCRMGDPETQPIMMRLWGDFAGLVDAAIDGQLDEVTVDWNPRPALGVVMAAENYPGAPRTGDVIYGLNRAAQFSDTLVFHAGTANRDGEVVTSGGRVLCVTALGDDVEAAQKRAYGVLAAMSFDGMQCRRDIGTRALKEWRRLR
jgi:phosphoribosylamine--glycine ligase